MKTSVAVLAALALAITNSMASAQTLVTDLPDYSPGETATLTGAGFEVFELVTVQVSRADSVPNTPPMPETWSVMTDWDGTFSTRWIVCADCAGAVLRATAEGSVSGRRAEVVFTDAPSQALITVTTNIPCALGATFQITRVQNNGNTQTSGGTTSQTFSVEAESPFTLTSIAATRNGTTYVGPSIVSGSAGGANTTTNIVLNYADLTAPSLTVPGPVAVSTGVTPTTCGGVVSNATLGTASASDNCGTATVSRTGVPAGNVFPIGTTTVTYTATDGAGNTTVKTQTVTVTDNTPPVLALLGEAAVTVECHGAWADPGATAADLCAGNLTGAIQVTGTVDPDQVGTYALGYTVSDGHGNTASASRTVNVVDTTSPTLTLVGGSSMTAECHGGFTDPGASAVDACSGDAGTGILSSAVQVSGAVDANSVGDYVLSYTVTDGQGNTASASRTVRVVDTTPPALALVGDATMTVECHGEFGDPGASASDLCSGDLSGAIQVSGAVDANTVGEYVLSYSVTDGQGNTATASRAVRVVDTTPPAVTAPQAITVLTGPDAVACSVVLAEAELGTGSATDACAGTLGAVPVSLPPGRSFPVGLTVVTWSASDASGNVATAEQQVTVIDNTPPALTAPASVSAFTGDGATTCGALVTDIELGVAVVNDNCPGAGFVRSGVPTGNVFPVGITTLTYLATDAAGNTTSRTQTVTVADNSRPVLTAPADIAALVDPAQCTAVVAFEASVTDNCPGAVVVCSPPSGYAFPVGQTAVSCTATDVAGNEATATFTVTVSNPAPTVTITGPASGALFAVGKPVTFTGTFADNAGDVHTATWAIDGAPLAGVVDEAGGSVTATRTFTTNGVYFVRLTVADQCGGEATASQIGGLDAMIVVYDPTAGSVTGGGWIHSPAGAYVPDASLAGRANFGFVSKYQRGATTPSGETEFQFKAGSLNFHSSRYDWMVISGAKVQYKGHGTINGAGDYTFTLTCVDGQQSGGGGADKFRIKIVDASRSDVVYDNQFGASDTSAATTVIGGGSIVIHAPSSGKMGTVATNSATTDRSLEGALPLEFALAQNVPNPLRVSTTVRFRLPSKSRVRIALFDVAGREVARIAEDERDAGDHAVAWSRAASSGARVGAGVYFVRMAAEAVDGSQRFSSVRKMIVE